MVHTTVFPAVMYGFETRSRTLRKEYKWQLFETECSLGIQKNEVSERFIVKPTNELCDLYRSPSDFKMVKSTIYDGLSLWLIVTNFWAFFIFCVSEELIFTQSCVP